MMRCHWRTMPWPLLLMMTVFTGRCSVKQVASSWLFIWNEPSPSMLMTWRSGWAACTPMAVAGHDHRLAAGEVGDLLDDVLRLDDVVAPLVAERLRGLPLGDLGVPCRPRLADAGVLLLLPDGRGQGP